MELSSLKKRSRTAVMKRRSAMRRFDLKNERRRIKIMQTRIELVKKDAAEKKVVQSFLEKHVYAYIRRNINMPNIPDEAIDIINYNVRIFHDGEADHSGECICSPSGKILGYNRPFNRSDLAVRGKIKANVIIDDNNKKTFNVNVNLLYPENVIITKNRRGLIRKKTRMYTISFFEIDNGKEEEEEENEEDGGEDDDYRCYFRLPSKYRFWRKKWLSEEDN